MRAQVIFGCSKCFENCCSIYTMYILFAYSFFQTSDSSSHYLLVCFCFCFIIPTYICWFLPRFFCHRLLLHLFVKVLLCICLFFSSFIFSFFNCLGFILFFLLSLFRHFIQLFTQTNDVTFTSWRSLDEKNNHFITFSHHCYFLLWTLHNKDEWHMFPSRCSSIKRIHPRYDSRF